MLDWKASVVPCRQRRRHAADSARYGRVGSRSIGPAPRVPLPMGKGSVGGGAAGEAHGVDDEHDDAPAAVAPNTRQAAEQALRVGGTGFYESGRPSFLLHPLRSANASGHTRMPAMERSATSGRDSQRPRLGSAPQARGAATTHAASAAPKHRGPPKGKDASAGRDPDKDLQARDDVDDDGETRADGHAPRVLLSYMRTGCGVVVCVTPRSPL